MSSAVIHALKTVEERLPGNYTSGQLFDVLDTFLYRAINPLIINTRYVDRCLAIVIAWYAQNHRRRISSLPKKRLTAYVMAFLAETDPKKRCSLYRRMRLERNITFFLINNWLSLIDRWPALHVAAASGEGSRQEERELLLHCCVISPLSLFGDIREVKYWLSQALDFKDKMIEKYMRHVMMEAYTHWQIQKNNNPQVQINFEELAQNFLLAVIKAIDKFDARRGTLTAYIDNWLKNAKITQQFRGEYGLAYTIPHSKRTALAQAKDNVTRNFSVNIDSPEALEVVDDRNIEASIERQQELQVVRDVAKACDPMGIGRLLLGIPESLTEYELAQLRSSELQKVPA